MLLYSLSFPRPILCDTIPENIIFTIKILDNNNTTVLTGYKINSESTINCIRLEVLMLCLSFILSYIDMAKTVICNDDNCSSNNVLCQNPAYEVMDQ